jgi:hypothetical protein
MRLLLDESVPTRLKAAFGDGVSVTTVTEMGWAGTKNGELLRRAALEGFIALAIADRGIEYQQRLDSLPVAVIVMVAFRNRIADLEPLVPQIERLLEPTMERRVYHVAV